MVGGFHHDNQLEAIAVPTTSLGIRYPDSTDNVNVPEDVQNVAQDVDDLLLQKGYVIEDVRTSSSSNFTTTELVIQSVTFTAVSTVRYKVTALQGFQSSVANDIIEVRLRYQAGGTLTSGGTQIRAVLFNCDVANRGNPVTLVGTFTGVSGQVTVGVTGVRDTGTGNHSSFGRVGDGENYILVEGI